MEINTNPLVFNVYVRMPATKCRTKYQRGWSWIEFCFIDINDNISVSPLFARPINGKVMGFYFIIIYRVTIRPFVCTPFSTFNIFFRRLRYNGAWCVWGNTVTTWTRVLSALTFYAILSRRQSTAYRPGSSKYIYFRRDGILVRTWWLRL